MSMAIGGDRSRLQARSSFSAANNFIGKWPPDRVHGLVVNPFDGRESDAFDRRERRINDV